ncbi:MAG: hypothetical protein COS99_06805 [Candidatus Omnitrophica bacterium CG07_land_8_20_14_0_80_42_15]|uniref:SPOR domain-containing protein n=1 Tax=Candidatus Aquitaenariimonas noxiae TaxID=1974741 RepID=A0A2J0KX81_9BACT|nr:MAG: hypothetical protein COS99_06805 [Candidatus Omnitrophica bacterium CG07_land_8_20_14_0_80_42_15]
MKKVYAIICVFLLTSVIQPEKLLAIGTFSGVSWEEEEKREFSYRQDRALNEIEDAFLKGDYLGAVKKCDDILYLSKRYRSRKNTQDKFYYFAGIAYLKLDNPAKAKLYLNNIIREGKRSDLAPDACLAFAEAYFLEENYDEAAKCLLEYTKTYPTNNSLPEAYLKLGQVYQKMGRWEESKFYFDRIKKDFPLSFEASLAPSTSSSNGENFFFSVQLGVFNNLDNAKKLKKDLEDKGYFPYIVEVKSEGETSYRLRVGKLKSKTEAESLASELKKKGFDTKVCP